MAEEVTRCPSCGQFTYRLVTWMQDEVIIINAGTKQAFVVDEIATWRVADIPVMKLTDEVPANVFTIHKCKAEGG